MIVVNSLPVAICFCVITMLGWGSWANTQKLAGKEKWPFQLFYWDYDRRLPLQYSLRRDLRQLRDRGPARWRTCDPQHRIHQPALISGAIFNLSTSSVVGIDAAGMSVAFPSALDSVMAPSKLSRNPQGDLLFTGVALIVFAISCRVATSACPRAA